MISISYSIFFLLCAIYHLTKSNVVPKVTWTLVLTVTSLSPSRKKLLRSGSEPGLRPWLCYASKIIQVGRVYRRMRIDTTAGLP
jgi:hypothetical protein